MAHRVLSSSRHYKAQRIEYPERCDRREQSAKGCKYSASKGTRPRGSAAWRKVGREVYFVRQGPCIALPVPDGRSKCGVLYVPVTRLVAYALKPAPALTTPHASNSTSCLAEVQCALNQCKEFIRRVRLSVRAAPKRFGHMVWAPGATVEDERYVPAQFAHLLQQRVPG